jgi:hypothetical protein
MLFLELPGFLAAATSTGAHSQGPAWSGMALSSYLSRWAMSKPFFYSELLLGNLFCNLVGNFSFFSVCVQHTRSNEKFWSIFFFVLLQASPAGIFSLLGGVYLWVPRDCKRETLFCSYGNRLPFIPSLQLLWCLFVCFCPGHVLTDLLTGNTGMTKVSYCWELDVLTDSKWLCHHQYCPVIACILVSLLLPIMLRPQTAVSQYSTTQGWLQIIHALW